MTTWRDRVRYAISVLADTPGGKIGTPKTGVRLLLAPEQDDTAAAEAAEETAEAVSGNS